MDGIVKARKKVLALVEDNKQFAAKISANGGYCHASAAINRARGAVELALKIGLISAKKSDELRQSML